MDIMTAIAEQPVKFDSGNILLAGIFSKAESARAVVIIHGWGSYRIGPHRMLVHAARRMRNQGFSTLRFDLRGRGDSAGISQPADLDQMISDTTAAIDFTIREAGAKEISLLGLCSGANIAIGAATLRSDICKLALWSALPFQPEQKASDKKKRTVRHLMQYAEKAATPETWVRAFKGNVDLRGVVRTLRGTKNAESCGRNLKDSRRNILAEFGNYKGRVLFVTGGKDPDGIIGRGVFQEFCSRNSINAEFHLIEGASHNFSSPVEFERAMLLTEQFINSTATAGK